MKEIKEIYRAELEVFLSTLGVFVGDKKISLNKRLNEENRKFIKEKFIILKSGNVDEEILDLAISEILPYLCQK